MKKGRKPKYSYHELKELTGKLGWKLLSSKEEYENFPREVRFKCRCGRRVTKPAVSFDKGKGFCKACRTESYSKREITTQDGTFSSVAEAARYYGLDYGVLHSRLSAGWSPNAAVGLELPQHDEVSRDLDAVGFIYKIENQLNGKVYIGLTSRSIKIRYQGHVKSAQSGSRTLLHKAMRKYGEQNFKVTRLAKATLRELPDLERRYIQKFDSTNRKRGYNSVAGGSFGGTNLGHSVTYNGRTYHSWRAFAEKHKLNYSLCTKLLNNGTAPKDVINECHRRSELTVGELVAESTGHKIVIKGVPYTSIREACRMLDINNNTVTRRLHQGWPLDLAFSKKKYTRATTPYKG